MVSVRDRFVPTGWPVRVTFFVSGAGVLGCAGASVGSVFGQFVFVNMVIVHMMQVSIVQIIGVPFVLDSFVTARCSVLMLVL